MGVPVLAGYRRRRQLRMEIRAELERLKQAKAAHRASVAEASAHATAVVAAARARYPHADWRLVAQRLREVQPVSDERSAVAAALWAICDELYPNADRT